MKTYFIHELRGRRKLVSLCGTSFLTIHPTFLLHDGIFSSLILGVKKCFWLPHQCQLILSLVRTWANPLLIYVYLRGAMFHVHLAKVPFHVNIFHELRGQRKLVSHVTCHSWPSPFLLHDGIFSSLSLECEEVFWRPHRCQLILNLVHTFLANPFLIHVYFFAWANSFFIHLLLPWTMFHVHFGIISSLPCLRSMCKIPPLCFSKMGIHVYKVPSIYT